MQHKLSTFPSKSAVYSSSKSKTNGGFELLSHSLEGSAIYKKASVLDGGGLQLTLYAASLTALTIRKIEKNWPSFETHCLPFEKNQPCFEHK